MRSIIGLIVLVSSSVVNLIHSSYLYERFPELSQALPRLELIAQPTKIVRASAVSALDSYIAGIGHCTVYVKYDGDLRLSDGQSSLPDGIPWFGGNKMRKGPGLFADALSKKADAIITYGSAASNHALEMAACASFLNIPIYLILEDQEKNHIARHHLALGASYGAHYEFWPEGISAQEMAERVIKKHDLQNPYIIPVGGSNALGTLGYVDGALELCAQIDAGEMPEPAAIYVPCGSMGTAVGIAVGLQIAGRKIPVHAVRAGSMANEQSLKELFEAAVALLRSYGAEIAEDVIYDPQLLCLRHDFVGKGYSIPLAQHGATVALFRRDGIALDPSYTGKAAVCMVYDIVRGHYGAEGSEASVLFWHTYCDDAERYQPLPVESDYFPEELRKYVQY